jgi:hypothetical protein
MNYRNYIARLVCLVTLNLGISVFSHADVLVLENGDRITGEISRIWDAEVTIEPEYSDEFEVDLSAVVYIETERVFEIELYDGRSLLARFAGADADGYQLIEFGGQSISVPLSTIFELDEPEDPFEWESNVAISVDMNKGNTDTANGQIRADTMVRIRSTTKEQDIFRYNYNFLFNDPWFFASSFTFERDPISELDSRVIISAGIGRDVWDVTIPAGSLWRRCRRISQSINYTQHYGTHEYELPDQHRAKLRNNGPPDIQHIA